MDKRTELYNLMYELDTRAPKVWMSLVNAWIGEVTFFQEVDDEWLVTDDATDDEIEMLIAEVRNALANLDDSTGNPDHPTEADAEAHDEARIRTIKWLLEGRGTDLLRPRLEYRVVNNHDRIALIPVGAGHLYYTDGLTISDAHEAAYWAWTHNHTITNPEYLLELIGGA